MTEQTIKYPGVSDRIRAAVFDSIVVILLLFSVTFLLSQFENVSETIKKSLFLFIFVLYDPIFTSLFGGTIGHMAMKIKVKRRANTDKNIMLPQAIVRFILKFVLGIFSLLTIGRNSQNLAIHDHVSGSIVLFK